MHMHIHGLCTYFIFSCEEAALEGLTEVSGSQTIVYIVMHLYVPSV